MPQKPSMKLIKKQVGPWQMNTYALICHETGKSVLIDPGAEPDILTEMVRGTDPVAILLTHSHGDHIGALAEMRQRLDVPLMAHAGPHKEGVHLNPERSLATGDRVQVGSHTLIVYETPGHIKDQICFAIEEDSRIIVGDTIFEGGPGKTWSSEQFQESLQTLRDVVLSWPDDSICYPGHGPEFQLGDLRGAIEAFLARDHGDFYGDATWDM
jgi:glyoxylase-like metal-dependent hydrolase (beta-lactamase superfamily II)